jgi:hypothetical protein
MILSLDITKLSRSMTREEWRAVDRWRRITQKELAIRRATRIAQLAIFETAISPEALEFYVRAWTRLCDEQINPPLLLVDPLTILDHVKNFSPARSRANRGEDHA